MERAFLYIDILGFKDIVYSNPEKIQEIFLVIDSLQVHNEYNLKVIAFSDTVVVFTEEESLKINYYVNDLVEYTQELFYKLSAIQIFFKATITFGDFNYFKMKNIEAYFGDALIKSYVDTEELEGFGLYIDNDISDWIRKFKVVKLSPNYSFILLCSSIVELHYATKSASPEDIKFMENNNDLQYLKDDLNFLSIIYYLKDNLAKEKVRRKYQKVYNIYKNEMQNFFEQFENNGFELASLQLLTKGIDISFKPPKIKKQMIFTKLLKKIWFRRRKIPRY